MIFDWLNSKEEALKNGIVGKEILGSEFITMQADDGIVAHHTFRNFDRLTFTENTLIENCIFVNCAEIDFDTCQIHQCEFRRVDNIIAEECNFINSKFTEMKCDEDLVVMELSDCKISHCRFDNITIGKGAYLINGFGNTWFACCQFCNIRTADANQEITLGEKNVGKILKRKQRYSIVDIDSCML